METYKLIKYLGKHDKRTFKQTFLIYCRDTDISLAMSFEEFDFPIIGKSYSMRGHAFYHFLKFPHNYHLTLWSR